VIPVLTTNLRSTQTLDPAGVARSTATRTAGGVAGGVATGWGGTGSVTTSSYPVCATHPSVASVVSAANAIGGAWSITGLAPMPKVDFHPDRWPLHSTS
jgi:hypothetical protein